MSIFDDLKAKADANGDGKIDFSDVQGLKDQLPADQFEKLQGMADSNGDGKINLDDLKSVDMDAAADSLKDSWGGLFGKK
jgi:Ca2+-binding EF-hand superfamily protein